MQIIKVCNFSIAANWSDKRRIWPHFSSRSGREIGEEERKTFNRAALEFVSPIYQNTEFGSQVANWSGPAPEDDSPVEYFHRCVIRPKWSNLLVLEGAQAERFIRGYLR